MNELEQRIKKFADGQWPDRDIPGRIRKLGEEFGELSESVARLQESKREKHRIEVIAEAADCAIVLADLLALLNHSLEGAMLWKLDIVERRFNSIDNTVIAE